MLGLTEDLYIRYLEYIKLKTGVTFSHNGLSTLNNRLIPILIKYKLENYKELFYKLLEEKDEDLLNDFIDKVTTHHTYFYREDTQFEILTQKIFPEQKHQLEDLPEHKLKYWVAACSTGEEAYTVAMLLDAFFRVNQPCNCSIKILATDVSRRAIQTACHGEYRESVIEKLPSYLREQYTTKLQNGKSEISPKIKRMIDFRVLNLLRKDFPFQGKFDIIFLRNVLIYFDDETRDNLIGQLNDFLNYNGYLFIGLTESLLFNKFGLKQIYPSIYKKSIGHVEKN
ncbi:MAG: protein-glutamate O-methyltransferase CheR [Leptospiraceae bacterium]|nr:protein-glutamate O-methyltransferase CheR [Leptospiraceae bacterium]MCK6382040.1 protein-glutamate O-methyltransferase CheR [Leptospiraceae bacterium]NUM40805.1 protein-glutamate O-methyltransferase CheR [Leptospiraceae bacterium]